MNHPQFTPDLMRALAAKKQELSDRARRGELTVDEAATLYKEAASKAFEGVRQSQTAHERVTCPACSKQTDLIGNPGSWRCACSPGVTRSVVDCRDLR